MIFSIGEICNPFKQLADAWIKVEGKQDLYIEELTSEDEVQASEPWLAELHDIYSEVKSIYDKYENEQLLKEKEQELLRKFEQLTKKKSSLEAIFQSLLGTTKKLLSYCAKGKKT